MRKRLVSSFMIVCLMLMHIGPLYAQSVNMPEDLKAQQASAQPAELSLEEMAKKSNNPIGDAWMLWTQYDWTRYGGDVVPGHEYVGSLKVQPVMPFPVMGGEWNLLVRPIFQFNTIPLDKDIDQLLGFNQGQILGDPTLSSIAAGAFNDRTTGLGDTILMTILGPNREDGTIWAVGMTQLFPTASEDVLGSEKYGAGPAFLFASLAPEPRGWNYGALGQTWFSYAGDKDRKDVVASDIQYFLNYRLNHTDLIGMSPNIKINWEAKDHDNKVTFPVGLGYSTVKKVGRLPVRFALEFQYNVIKPDNVGADWNIKFMVIPVIPNPFKKG